MLETKHCMFQGPGIRRGPGPGLVPGSGPGPDIQAYKNNKKIFYFRTLTHSTAQKIKFSAQDTLNYLFSVSVLSVHAPNRNFLHSLQRNSFLGPGSHCM